MAVDPLDGRADDDLMVLARAGREDAFEVLVRRHQPLVLGIATRFLASEGRGRDVAQDVFLALWAERERFRPRGRFRGFLAAMTLNRCRAVARQARTTDRRIADLAREADERDAGMPLDALLERERAREVRASLAEVPARQREALILRFGHDLSLDEIAEATRVPLGTVKSDLFRGLKRLRALLGTEAAP